MAALTIAAPAGAAAPDLLLRLPEGHTMPGAGAGELERPYSVAGDPNSGHLFVGDFSNARISEYTAWGLFVKSWGWGVEDGSEEFQTCGPASPESNPSPGICQRGIVGDGAGQLDSPWGGAVDADGNVYVLERSLVEGGEPKGARVQKFDAAGNFLLMFGGEVNKTTGENLCTKVSGHVCGAGVLGSASGEFATTALGDYLAYNPVTDTIFVGDEDRIQEFNTDGTFKSQIAFEGPDLEALDGKTVTALDIDPSGNLYLVVDGPENENVFKLSLTGELLESFGPVQQPGGLTVDAAGNLYVIERLLNLGLQEGEYVLGFDTAGKPIPGMEPQDAFAKVESEIFPSFGGIFSSDLSGIATNFCTGSEAPGNLYAARSQPLPGYNEPRSYISAYGTPPIGCEPPPLRPPLIGAQYAISVNADGATLRAQIGPRFWDDATYYVQYGTEACSAGGCKEQPLAPGVKLTDQVTSDPVTTKGIFLGGLEPDTTYHYRFVAQSTGGGPVFGVGGEPGKDGAEGTFKTFPAAGPSESCPANEQFRVGASARLPDCRAYELVSPLDKNNSDIAAGGNLAGEPVTLYQSSTSGERFTYSAARSFGDPEGAPNVSQYLAARNSAREEWVSEAISPPRTRLVLGPAGALENEYKAFSPDLCTAWLRHDSDPPLTGDAVPGFPNLYRRESCGASGYEALSAAQPFPVVKSFEYAKLELQGVAAEGAISTYVAPASLEGTTAPANKDARSQLYVHSKGEQMRFACVLPSGKAWSGACSAGAFDGLVDRGSNVHNALSADGSRLYWTAFSVGGPSPGPGQLYLRINPSQEQSALEAGECSEAEKACSFPVSPAGEDARFWSAAADGSKAIFTVEEEKSALDGDLYEFTLDDGLALIAKKVGGVVGASEDASRVYFASTEALDGAAEAGEPNLYLHEEGQNTFIAQLAELEVEPGFQKISKFFSFSPTARKPKSRVSRVSPDGLHMAFMSSANPSPTGYDNLDANSGEPDTEVYLYDAEEEKLICASCNPSGARPTGRVSEVGNRWVAAKLAPWGKTLYAPRVLSEDGERLFFESYEALVPRDTNGAQDVYQWEAVGKGGCDEGDASFVEDSGGCLDLISSGESPGDSTFLDASPSGGDVFIGTLSSLVPQDYGLVDVYDARLGGGLPAPPAPVPSCEGETCQGPLAPPEDPTPASSAFQGAGNVVSAGKPSCRKGKVRRKGRCVPRKSRKRAQRANHERRVGR